MTTQVQRVLPKWMAGLPGEEGFVHISTPRRYAHEEAGYDQYYSNDPANMNVGRGVVAMMREAGADLSGPAVEIGCGTGLVSLGLAAEAAEGAYPLAVITDPSPEFLKITQKKIRAHGVSEERVAYAVLMGEEIDRLPEGEFSLVVLRSTLHHVLHVEKFIRDSARALRPGGVLAFQEPCMEGYVLMGALVQFLPALAAAAGKRLTEEQAAKVKLFADSMSFYTRRDVDKSRAEDKHLFRVDELMKTGEECGLTVRFHANTTFDAHANEPGSRPGPDLFGPFFRAYAKYCMAWDEGLMGLFDELLAPYAAYVDGASAGGSGPYQHGVFVCVKK